LEDGAVMLEPEIKKYFPDSESVNKALRSLLELMPSKNAKRIASSRQKKPTERY
jgi:hypothetical protein